MYAVLHKQLIVRQELEELRFVAMSLKSVLTQVSAIVLLYPALKEDFKRRVLLQI